LDLASFNLEQATLEIRYPIALQLWDKCGSVWELIREKWAGIDIVPSHAEPSRTIFRAGKNTLTIEMEAARITTPYPDRSLDEFGKSARDFVTAVVQGLKIPHFKRVGFRPVYFWECATRERAVSTFFSLGLVKLPEGKRFEVSEHPRNAQYILRWESDAKGVLLQVRDETRKLDFDPPPELADSVDPVHTERHGITLDVDYYTVAPVEPAQLDLAEWIRHSTHVIGRDTKYVFGE